MSNGETLQQLNPYYYKGNDLSNNNEYQKVKQFSFTIAEFDLEKFLNIFTEFNQVFNKETTKFSFMFEMYKNIALQLFSKEEYGEMQVFCIACYIAHYLELAISRNKNIGNNISFNTETPSTTVSRNIGAKERKSLQNEFNVFYNQTSYGRMLYPYMKIISGMRVRGVY